MISDKVRRLAREAFLFFKKGEGEDEKEFWYVADNYNNNGIYQNCPEWVKNLPLFGKEGTEAQPLLDDWTYLFIAQSLITLQDDQEPIYPNQLTSWLASNINRTNQLTSWLASNVNRVNYVDLALEYELDGRPANSVISLIMMGQMIEKEEVFRNVVSYLENVMEAEE